MNEETIKWKNIINPPPSDKRCQCCNRHIDELEPYGGPDDPLVGDFRGAFLVQTFRCILPDQVESSWECRDCIVLDNDEYLKIKLG